MPWLPHALYVLRAARLAPARVVNRPGYDVFALKAATDSKFTPLLIEGNNF
jgi:hypothetical protein